MVYIIIYMSRDTKQQLKQQEKLEAQIQQQDEQSLQEQAIKTQTAFSTIPHIRALTATYAQHTYSDLLHTFVSTSIQQSVQQLQVFSALYQNVCATKEKLEGQVRLEEAHQEEKEEEEKH